MVNNRIYFPYLDGLRGWAAFSVMLFHTGLFWHGWVGVQVFFVLSGFLITQILYKNKDKSDYFSIFYLRRILRIFPIYYLGILSVIIIYSILYLNVKDAIYYILYIQNFKLGLYEWEINFPKYFNHTWSLAIEEQFYLFFPFIIRYSNLRNCIFFVFLLIVTGIFSKILLYSYFPKSSLIWCSTFSNLDLLGVGGLLALMFQIVGVNKIRRYLIYSCFVTIVTFFLLNYFWLGIGIYSYPFELDSKQGILFLIAILPFTAFLIFYLCIYSNFFNNLVFGSRPLRYIGKISYGLYFYHLPVFYFIDFIAKTYNIQHYGYVVIFLKFLVTLLIATISWLCYESFFLKYKERVKYK